MQQSRIGPGVLSDYNPTAAIELRRGETRESEDWDVPMLILRHLCSG
jgi:hypothetical protein